MVKITTAQETLSIIKKATEDLLSSLPDADRDIFKKILLLSKELEVKDGKITNSPANLKILSTLGTQIEKAILTPSYLQAVGNFLKAFNSISSTNDSYFSSFIRDFKVSETLKNLKEVSIKLTAESLTKAGLSAGVVDKVEQMLKVAITSGGDYFDLVSALRDLIVGTSKSEAVLVRYVRQIATDSLNQFSASYNNQVAKDLGLQWYMYLGSLMETSRPWCMAMVKKKYIHISELPKIVKGQVGDTKITINPSTGVWEGGIKGTNESNVIVYRGGYNCGHQFVPIPDSLVPASLLNRTSS